MGGVDVSFFLIGSLLTSQILLEAAYSFFLSIYQPNIYLISFLKVFRADFLLLVVAKTFVSICLSKEIYLFLLSLKYIFSSISFIYRVCILARNKK